MFIAPFVSFLVGAEEILFWAWIAALKDLPVVYYFYVTLASGVGKLIGLVIVLLIDRAKPNLFWYVSSLCLLKGPVLLAFTLMAWLKPEGVLLTVVMSVVFGLVGILTEVIARLLTDVGYLAHYEMGLQLIGPAMLVLMRLASSLEFTLWMVGLVCVLLAVIVATSLVYVWKSIWLHEEGRLAAICALRLPPKLRAYTDDIELGVVTPPAPSPLKSFCTDVVSMLHPADAFYSTLIMLCVMHSFPADWLTTENGVFYYYIGCIVSSALTMHVKMSYFNCSALISLWIMYRLVVWPFAPLTPPPSYAAVLNGVVFGAAFRCIVQKGRHLPTVQFGKSVGMIIASIINLTTR